MEPKELLRLHPSVRDSLALLVWPVIGIFVVNFVIKKWIWHEMTFVWMLIIGLVLLLVPAWAWLKTRFDTFFVFDNAVASRHGLISKDTSEIRISDIRAINIRQSIFDRIMRVGRIAFSSAASGAPEGEEEVIFFGVHNPEEIKRLVQRQMPGRDDSDDGE